MEIIKNIFEATVKQIIIIFVYIFVLISLQLLFREVLLGSNLFLNTIIYIMIELILLIIFLFIFRKIYVPDYYDFKKNGRKYIDKYFRFWLLGLVVMLVSNILIGLFVKIPSTNQDLNESLLITMPIYGVLSTIIFAPFVEEGLTRICFKDVFKNKYIYFTLSGLIFGALHLINAKSPLEYLYIIPYGALGYSFAAIYKESNNIWTNIFFHAMHNAIAITIIFLGAL